MADTLHPMSRLLAGQMGVDLDRRESTGPVVHRAAELNRRIIQHFGHLNRYPVLAVRPLTDGELRQLWFLMHNRMAIADSFNTALADLADRRAQA